MVEMRKPHKQIQDPAEVEIILRRENVLRLAMCRDGRPYLLPFNYGYEPGRLYVHTGPAGLKLDILRANPNVCFEVSTDIDIVPGDAPCAWETSYRSVIGFGRAVILNAPAEKIEGLRVITVQHAGPGKYEFPPDKAARATVIRIDIESMTGRRNPA